MRSRIIFSAGYILIIYNINIPSWMPFGSRNLPSLGVTSGRHKLIYGSDNQKALQTSTVILSLRAFKVSNWQSFSCLYQRLPLYGAGISADNSVC